MVRTASIPCGCRLLWDANKTTLYLCHEHVVKYVTWEGNAHDFIKMVATPRVLSPEMVQLQK